jgi:hypothetical protein
MTLLVQTGISVAAVVVLGCGLWVGWALARELLTKH